MTELQGRDLSDGDVIRFVSYIVKGCRICHRHQSHHETRDFGSFRKLFLKCSFGMTHNRHYSLCVVGN